MGLPVDPTLNLSLDVIKRPANQPDQVGELRAAREGVEVAVSPADDRNYFRARGNEHRRLAAEAKNPAARAVHLEFAERYYERSLEADDGSWENEGGSWQSIPRSSTSQPEVTQTSLVSHSLDSSVSLDRIPPAAPEGVLELP